MLFKIIFNKLKTDSGDEKCKECLDLFARFKHNTAVEHVNNAQSNNERIVSVVNWARRQGYLDGLEISDKNAEILLRSFLGEGDLPKELIRNEKLRKELAQVLAKRAVKKSVVRPGEVQQAMDLISTGELFEDVSYSIATIISLAVKPDHYFKPDEHLQTFVEGLIKLPGAVASDLDAGAVAEKISQQIRQIQSGQPLQNPNILDNTLAGIFALSEIGEVIDTANNLLDEENKSLRLAFLIYARLNGINFEQQDIDKVRLTVLNSDHPDLGNLLMYIGDKDNFSRIIL